MRRIYILSGPPFAGKSSWAGRKTCSIISRSSFRDGLREQVKSSKLHPFKMETEERLWGEMIGKKMRETSGDVIIDQLTLTPPAVEKILRQIDTSIFKGVEEKQIFLVLFNTGLDNILKRNKDRGEYIPENKLKKMWYAHQSLVKNKDFRNGLRKRGVVISEVLAVVD